MKRLPIIRHIRHAWLAWRFWFWWNAAGRYMGAVPNPADIKFLRDVWDGKA